MKTALIASLLLLFTGIAHADSIWSYQGNTMQGCNCSLSGTLTLPASGNKLDDYTTGAIPAWDFTDGTHTLDQNNSVAKLVTHLIGTTFNAPLGTWELSIAGNDGKTFLFSLFYGSYYESQDGMSFAGGVFGESGNPGVWTPVATPEPSALLLMVFGLVLCIAGRSRLKRLA